MTSEQNGCVVDGIEYAYCDTCGFIVYREEGEDVWLFGAAEILPRGLDEGDLPTVNCGCNE